MDFTISTKCILGFIFSLALLMCLMPSFINFLKRKKMNQVSSEYSLEEFKQKARTPIMGGLMFIVCPILVFGIIGFKYLSDKTVLFVMASYVCFSIVGFLDDKKVIASHSNDGLSPITRLIMEFVITCMLFVFFKDQLPLQVTIPFLNIGISLGWFIYLPFMILLYMAEANAVNFTDGMDGLCAGVSFIGLVPFIIFAFKYGFDALSLLLICIEGGLLGYLYFNHHPAKIFMGDSGSLGLGALFASLGLLLDKTIALFVIGGVFVVEMFCVVVQQVSVRLFHKRVFSYTPIHYAFVIKGYKENKIVYGFYVVAIILALIGYFIGINTL